MSNQCAEVDSEREDPGHPSEDPGDHQDGVNSTDVLVNPGIWGALDYREKLAAYKQSLKSSTQNDLTPSATTNPLNRAKSDVIVEEPSASITTSRTLTSITTIIAHRDPREPISSSRPAPAAPAQSLRYQGDPNLKLNVAAKVESSQNVRFWVTGLPPSITTQELLGAIRGVGSIFATNIVKPQLPEAAGDNRQRVWTSAASVTFFTPEAGNIFIKKSLKFGKYEALIRRNRIATAPMPENNRSRVLIIEGDPELVNIENLERLVALWDIQYITDSIAYTSCGSTNRVFWAFGSFRAQAHAVFLRLRDLSAGGKVYVRYGTDPCASFQRSRDSHKRTTKAC
ncbi:hypothetical protein F5Y14DRAFT_460076 [Nemania sp. NC0429]|nr:hypothetical protein F5Y14DRAFT_460076 [Nemania sp. NC0429]